MTKATTPETVVETEPKAEPSLKDALAKLRAKQPAKELSVAEQDRANRLAGLDEAIAAAVAPLLGWAAIGTDPETNEPIYHEDSEKALIGAANSLTTVGHRVRSAINAIPDSHYESPEVAEDGTFTA